MRLTQRRVPMRKEPTLQDENNKSKLEKLGKSMLKPTIDELEIILQGLKDCDIVPNGSKQDNHVSHWVGKLDAANKKLKDVNLKLKAIYASIRDDL